MPENIDRPTLEQLESEFAAAMRALLQRLIRDHAINDNIIAKDVPDTSKTS